MFLSLFILAVLNKLNDSFYFLSFLCPQFFFVSLFEGTSSKVTSITKAKSDLNDKSKKGDQKNKNRKFMSSYDFGSNSFFLGKIRNKKANKFILLFVIFK